MKNVKYPRRSRKLTAVLISTFLILIFSVLFLSIGLEMVLHFQTLKRSIAREQKLIAQTAASSVSGFIQERVSILETVTKLGDLVNGGTEYQERILAMLIGSDPAVRNVVVYDNGLKEIAHATRQSEQQYQAFLTRARLAWAFFQDDGPRIGYVNVDSVTNEPLVTISVPVEDVFGFIYGRLVAEVNLKFMWETVGRLKIGETGQAYVVDKRGKLLAHRDIARVLRRDSVEDVPEVAKFLQSQGYDDSIDVVRTQGIDGKQVLTTYVPLVTPNWAVVTELPVGEAYADVFRSAVYSLILLAAFSVLVVFFVHKIAKRLSRPIVALTRVSTEIAQGDLSREADEEGLVEIAALAVAFNTMTRRLTNMLTREERRSHELQEEIKLRHRTELALRESEERLELALNAANEGIWDWNMAEDSLHLDDRFYNLAGYQPKEFNETHDEWRKRIHPDDLQKVLDNINSYIRGDSDSFSSELRFQRSDGTYMWVKSQGMIVSRDDEGRPLRFIGTHSDITTRKAAEEDVNRAWSLISNIIDSMPSILIGVNMERKVIFWNLAAVEHSGISTDEARGRDLIELLPWISTDSERIEESMRTHKSLRLQNRKRYKNSKTLYEDYTIFPLIGEGVQGAVLRIDDVTEKMRLEEMMLQSEKMLSVGGLAAGMAHEINNPLGGMIQNAGLVINRMTNTEIPANIAAAQEVGTDIDTISAYTRVRGIDSLLENVRKSGNRAAEIVTNMLSFARTSDTAHSTHSLADLLDKTVDLAGSDYNLKKKYDFRKIEIVREYEEIPEVPCESGKIQQVLLNVLRNGAEAMFEKSSADASFTPRFILRMSKGDSMARIEIEDNGPGMSEEVRKRVFEPFFTTKPTDVGTGLGLSVSYFIITENHSGKMSVESQPGIGTRFIIKLPLGSL